MALMPDVEDDSTEEKTLADRHESVTVDAEHVQATFEYTIHVPKEKLDELPENHTPEKFACDLACSQAQKDHNLTFSVHDAVAQQDHYTVNEPGKQFTVYVRTSQNQ